MKCKANCGRDTDYKVDPLDELCEECYNVAKLTLQEIIEKEEYRKSIHDSNSRSKK